MNCTASAHFRMRLLACKQWREKNCRMVSRFKLCKRTCAGRPDTVTQGCTLRHTGEKQSPGEAEQLVHSKGTGARCPNWHFRPMDGPFHTETQSTAARKKGKIVFCQTDSKGLWSKLKNTQVLLSVTSIAKPPRDMCCWRATAFVGARAFVHLPGSLHLSCSEVGVRPSSLAYRFSQASERFPCLDVISDLNNHNTPLSTPDSTAANSTTAFPHRAPPICSEGWVSKENDRLEAADPNITLTAISGKEREAKREQFCRLLYVKRLSFSWAGDNRMGMNT